MRRHNKPQRYSVDSGRLVRLKRSEHGSSDSPGKLLIDIAYTYKKLHSVSGLVRQDSDKVELETKTIWMYSDLYGNNARSVFSTDYIEYDYLGYPTRVVETSPTNAKTTTTYTYQHGGFDAQIIGKVKSIFNGADIQTFQYNSKGDVTNHTVNGVSTSYTWHKSGESKGEMRTMSTSPGNLSTYTRYKRGQAQSITNPSGYNKSLRIGDNGTIVSESRFANPSSTVSRNDPVTRYQYDARRRLKQIDPARTESTVTNYRWFSNNVLKISDGSKQRYEREQRFDGFGRIIAEGVFDRDQNRWSTIEYHYDSEGRLIFQSYPQSTSASGVLSSSNKVGVVYSYDALDRIKKIVQNELSGNDSVVDYVYGSDYRGYPTISQTDGRGSNTTTTFLANGTPHYRWPIEVIDADGTRTSIARNQASGRVNSFARGGQTTSYLYNSRKQLKSVVQGENGNTTFTYYDDGLVKTRTNQGRQVRFEYYSGDLLRKEIFTDNSKENITREYFYDTYMNLKELRTTSQYGSQNNTLKFNYDADNNVIQQELVIDGLRYELRYAYDELSNMKEIAYPNNRRYTFNPNSMGDPTAIKQIGGEGKILYSLIQYNTNNTMKLMRRAGHQVKNELNRGQRPSKYRLEQYGNGQYAALGERQYFYDKAANIKRINDSVSNRYATFTYDNRNRLTQENFSHDGNWEFGYDANDDISWMQRGNQLSKFEYHPSNHRLTRVRNGSVERRFEYDAQGNITAHERLQNNASKISRLLTYNAANQLVTMNDGTQYAYDARGLRVKQNRGGSIYTLYDQNEKLIYRVDSKTKVTSEYFYVNGKLVARRDEDRSGGSQNDPTTIPTKPTTVSPSGSGVSSNPVYTWKAIPGATHYYVDIRESSNNTVLIYQQYTAEQAGCAQGSGNCAVQKSDVPMSGAKRWRVRAKSAVGTGEWSAFAQFTVGGSTPNPPAAAPAVPSPAWPSGSITTSNPTYQWNAVAGAASYYLEVQNSSNAVRIWKQYTALEMGCLNAGERCRIAKSDAPMNGANRWRVKSVNGVGNSAWSGWKNFNVSH